MSRTSKLWLGAAGGVVVVTVAIVFAFGLTPAPSFPSLYEEGAPKVEGTVAYMEYGAQDCIYLFDVATGESRELYCDFVLWIEDWDEAGNLMVGGGSGHVEQLLVLDPATGAVLRFSDFAPDEDPIPYRPRSDLARGLITSSHEGHATLSYREGNTETILIDADGPRQYGFWESGVTADGKYAWVFDSEERLLVVALDAAGGPWLVAEDVVGPVLWK